MIRLIHDGKRLENDLCGKWKMNEHTRMEFPDDTLTPAQLEEEILIGRIIDGEAKPEDDGRFEELAAERPVLWRTLARRQRDMQLLAAQIDAQTKCAEHIELHGMAILPRRLTWTLALSGWAAMLIVALTWGAIVMYANYKDSRFDAVRDGGVGILPSPTRPGELTPKELLDLYEANAPWSVIEFPSQLLTTSILENGDLLIGSMRRFDEQIIIPAPCAEKLLKKQAQGETIPVDPVELEQLLRRLGCELKKRTREAS